jgi:hypothetical protein
MMAARLASHWSTSYHLCTLIFAVRLTHASQESSTCDIRETLSLKQRLLCQADSDSIIIAGWVQCG